MNPATPPSTPSLPVLRHQTFLHDRLPNWLIGADARTQVALRSTFDRREPWIETACQNAPQIARALADTYSEYQVAEADLRTLLAPLPELQDYARQLLEPALEQRFGFAVNVSATYLLNRRKAEAYRAASSGFINASEDPFVLTQRALKLATQSLLHSALQNFEAGEAQPGGLDIEGLRGTPEPSLILNNADVSPASDAEPVDIDPHAFAALVRQLDIGGNYQALIESIFTPQTPENSPQDSRTILRRAEQSKFRLHAHMAHLQGAIDSATYTALLDLATLGQAQYDGKPVLCSHMTLLHARLTGAVTFGIASPAPAAGRFPPADFPYAGWLVIYLPGTTQPLTVHTSRASAEAFLLQVLKAFSPSEHLPLIPDRHQQRFLNALQDTLTPLRLDPTGTLTVRTPDPDARVSLRLTPFTDAFLDTLVSQRQQRLHDDALFHAVPTALEDRKTAEQRQAYFLQLGLTALNIGSFFIPALRLPMLAFSMAQLGYETFEGLASWAADEREQAMGYLLDVAQNIALVTALGALEGEAGAVAAQERVPVETPSFIEELHAVILPDGSQRLWRPDLAPFAHDIVLPAGLTPDEFGLYHHAGKTWLPLDGSLYAIEQNPASGEHHVTHPAQALSYRPPLRSNGAGAWLTPLDDPQQWQGAYLLRRFGQGYAGLDDASAADLLKASGINESVLRRALSHSERAPALLEDALQRLTLDRQVLDELPTASKAARSAAFQRRYQSLPTSDRPGAPVLQRVYPQLPQVVIDELLRNLSETERLTLDAGKVPLRLGEEVRVYQQQLRLNRAYEGLYLQAAGGRDTDVLVLNAAQRLDHWPTDLRLALYEGQGERRLLDSVGPADARRTRQLTRHATGYTLSAPFPDSALLPVHDSIFAALEQLLGSAPGTLREQLRQAPAVSRDELRLKLGMQRRTFVSPMRLAEGRYGYPLSPTPSPKPLQHDLGRLGALNRHLRQLQERGLQPAISNEILRMLAELPLNHEQITARIAELPIDSALELESSLLQWRDEPGRVRDPEARAYSRDMIEIALWRHWINSVVPEVGDWNPALSINRTFIAEFPQQLPAALLASVRRLHLIDVWLDDSLAQNLEPAQLESHLDAVLQQVPHLEQLIIERPADWNTGPSAFQHSLGLIVARLPDLLELRIVNQGIVLDAVMIERLAALPHLRWLDLSGNTLVEQPNPGQVRLGQLRYLGLEQMALRRWPVWLSPAAIEQLEWLSLGRNQLDDLPRFLRLNETFNSRTTLVSLQGNPLDAQQMLHLAFSEDGLPRRFRFQLALTPAVQLPLQLLTRQRAELRESLDQWFASPLQDGETVATRAAVVRELSEHWEGRVRDLDTGPLQLSGLTLEHFPPVLPGFFSRHVDHLILEELNASSAQLDAFLRRFPQLTTLAVLGNLQSLGTLPAALSELPLLTELELVNQGLVIDDDALGRLLRLPVLESLDLSDNTLSPDLRGPFQVDQRLANLALNNTGLAAWPDWLANVMPTQNLDLSDNRISRLPDALLDLAVVDQPTTRIALNGNPLDEDVRERLERNGMAMTLLLPHDRHPR
ncbi:dermonecrotic toxin domain-containing protein [Pseudomonas sp.]|uniref:dermonecrotic toxin domain-containing protein n=1 Tax=Pseudomonas sp. TaxID=306 RepID=UPI0028A7BEDC|nr:DUF6543 domain-containing protein [Pseudomonas sp.]